jgi:hypothetical protein
MTFASSFRDPNNRSITFGTTGDVIMKSGLALRCLIVDSNTSFRIKSRGTGDGEKVRTGSRSQPGVASSVPSVSVGMATSTNGLPVGSRGPLLPEA